MAKSWKEKKRLELIKEIQAKPLHDLTHQHEEALKIKITCNVDSTFVVEANQNYSSKIKPHFSRISNFVKHSVFNKRNLDLKHYLNQELLPISKQTNIFSFNVHFNCFVSCESNCSILTISCFPLLYHKNRFLGVLKMGFINSHKNSNLSEKLFDYEGEILYENIKQNIHDSITNSPKHKSVLSISIDINKYNYYSNPIKNPEIQTLIKDIKSEYNQLSNYELFTPYKENILKIELKVKISSKIESNLLIQRIMIVQLKRIKRFTAKARKIYEQSKSPNLPSSDFIPIEYDNDLAKTMMVNALHYSNLIIDDSKKAYEENKSLELSEIIELNELLNY